MNFQALSKQIRQWLKVDLKLSRKGLILVFVPMSVILIILFCLAVLLNQAEFDVWRESESEMVISKANTVSRDFLNIWRLAPLYSQLETCHLI